MPNGKFIVTALTEEGESLCCVLVDSEVEGWMALGMNGISMSNHHYYQDHYPDGYTVECVPWKNTTTHMGVKRAIAAQRERKGIKVQ